MTRKEFFIQICEYLHEFSPLNEFKFSASRNEFRLRFPGGWQLLNMAPTFWSFLDVFDISPYFDIRFDVAQRWFEKYELNIVIDKGDGKGKCDLRGSIDVRDVRAYGMLHYDDSPTVFGRVRYEIDPNLFTQQNLLLFQEMILGNTSAMMEKCHSLTSFFENFVLPIIEGKKVMGIEGCMHSLFYYSAVCRIVAPELFSQWMEKIEKTKTLLSEQIQTKLPLDLYWFYYAEKYDEIMDYLVHYDFSKELAKLAPDRR